MKKLYLIILLLFISSCQSVDDAKKVLTNQKVKTTDEFLVKKKEPLELPPEFDKIPEPGSLEKKNKEISESKKLKQILKTTDMQIKKPKISGSTEKSILNKIRK